MASLFRQMNRSGGLIEKFWNFIAPSYNWGYPITDQCPSQVNLLYNVKREQLYGLVYPLEKAIPFRQLPFTAFIGHQSVSSFSTSSLSFSSSSSKSGDKSQEVDIFEKMDKTAYRLFYVELKENDKRKLSALWMQAMEGPCTGPEPTPTKGKNVAMEIEFWKDWMDLGDMSKEDAAKKYLKIAEKYV